MKGLELNPKPIITVNEARKILGADFKEIPDKVIKELIEELDSLSKIVIKNGQSVDKKA
ncbi:hypothetical protein GF357_05315 [Candidatus Dojkabacteria bacterium]|nr:hypothetical protein [Candidatus Dojkabacteria bacterium]